MRSLVSAGALVVACGAAAPASAEMITFSYVVTAGIHIRDDRFNLDGFDPTLGTLNSATVSISTHLEMQVRSHDGGILGFPVPIPYDFTVDDTLRLVGPNGQMFLETTQPAAYRVSGTNLVTSNIIDAQYGYAFTIDATSDLNGFASIHSVLDPGPFSAPVTAIGPLAGFVFGAQNFSSSEYLTEFTGAGGNFGLIGDVITFSTTHTIGVTYDYTPHTVPEPGTLALLGLGLAAGARLRSTFSKR